MAFDVNARRVGQLAALWGIAGFFWLLGYAVYRLTPVALQALSSNLAWYHWLVFTVNLGFMAYFEGYRGFQQGYSPRLIARVRYLQQHPTPRRVLLAPLFCMGYFDAPRRRMFSLWILTVVIAALVILFRLLPQPWRGILDAGVVVGLSWGIIVTLLLCIRSLRHSHFPHLPEVPVNGGKNSVIVNENDSC
jgi:hypothetical protein